MELLVVPVSKKRKKKRSYSPPPPKIKTAAPKKRKITTQQIIIYVISGLMILSLAIGFLVSGSGTTRTAPTPGPQATLLLGTPVPPEPGDAAEGTAEPEPTIESTSEN